jgi:hypothetical protein
MDLKWRVREASQLWLKWKDVSHLGDGKIELKSPSFYGPVLSDCLPLDERGQIPLDLTKHFIVLIPQPYIITLMWDKKLSQTTTEVKFNKITILDSNLGLLSILKARDEILIDCSDHTTENIQKKKYKVNFSAMVYNEFKQPYDLTKK